MRKLFSLIAAVLFAGSMMALDVTDVLDNALTGVSGTNYAEWSGKQATSKAVYAGQSAGGNSSIQLRSNNNNSGVVTTATGGTLKSVTVKFNSNTAAARVLDVYASNTAYTAATDLYGDNAGTKVASFKMEDGAEQSYTFEEEYTFFGFRSNSGALYLDEVDVVWVTEGEEVPATGIELDQPVLALKEFETATLVATLTPEGATTPVVWTSSDETVATVANGKVTAVAVGSAIITATAGEFSATCPVQVEAAPLLTCAEFAALEKGAKAKLNEVVITFAAADGKNIWLRDETGSLLLYYAAGGYELKAGDVVNGLVGTLTTYQTKVIELVPTVAVADLQVTEGDAPAPEEFTVAPTDADINKYVVIKGVTFATAEFESKNITATIGEETFTLRNNFNADQSFDTEKTYDITGLVSYYSNAVQVYFISAAEQGGPVIEEKDYYLVGNMTEWKPKADYKLALNEYAEGEEYWGEFTFAANDEFKVAYSADGQNIYDADWFPTGMDNNYKITEEGTYQVYFRPNYDGGEGWHEKVLFVLMQEKPIEEQDTTWITFTDGYVDGEYFAEWGTMDLILWNIPTEGNEFVGDGDYLVLDFYAESDKEISGTYSLEDETLDAEYTYLLRINGTDTAEVAFEAGELEILVNELDLEAQAANITFKAVLTSAAEKPEVFVFEQTMDVWYFIEEEEGVEETEAAVKAIKAIKNGQIIIEKNGIKYNVLGTIIR